MLFEKELAQRVSLPGRETAYHIPWRPAAPGRYQLLVTVDSGQEALLQGVKEFDAGLPVAEQGPARRAP